MTYLLLLLLFSHLFNFITILVGRGTGQCELFQYIYFFKILPCPAPTDWADVTCSFCSVSILYVFFLLVSSWFIYATPQNEHATSNKSTKTRQYRILKIKTTLHYPIPQTFMMKPNK